MTLYHGTSTENLTAIQQTGMLYGPVFLTPRKDVAAQYADEDAIIEVCVDANKLMIDFDLPGEKLLTVEEANEYDDNPDWDIYDYLDAGYSVGLKETIAI